MLVSVVIPYQRPNGVLEEAIRSIRSKEALEIILVCDGGDDLPSLDTSYPVFQIRKEWSGPSDSRNRGAERASGEYLLFMDSDFVPSHGCIDELLTRADKHICVVGMPLAPLDSSFLDWLIGMEYEDRYLRMPEVVSVMSSFCCLVPRNIFNEVGGFDGVFTRASADDWDFSQRVIKAGYHILHTNKAKGYHYSNPSLWGYMRKQYYQAKYRVQHKRLHGQLTEEYASKKMLMECALLGLPVAWRIYMRTGNLSSFALVPLVAVRNLVWALGYLRGTVE